MRWLWREVCGGDVVLKMSRRLRSWGPEGRRLRFGVIRVELEV